MKKKNLLWRKKPQTHSNALSDFRTDWVRIWTEIERNEVINPTRRDVLTFLEEGKEFDEFEHLTSSF